MKKLMTVAMLALSVATFAQTGKRVDEKSKENQSTEIRAKKDGDKKDCDKKDCDKKEGRKDGKHKGDKKRSEDKFADLNLTDVQKEKLKALKSERKFKDKMAQNAKPSKEEIQAKRAERDAKIKTILTPEQYQKISAKKEMKQNKEQKTKKA